jgi:preprotein translocase subunit SecE
MAEHDESLERAGARGRHGVVGALAALPPEVRNETSRVTWPSRKEVYATTIVVFLTSTFFGVYLFSVDLVLDAIMRVVYRTFGAA